MSSNPLNYNQSKAARRARGADRKTQCMDESPNSKTKSPARTVIYLVLVAVGLTTSGLIVAKRTAPNVPQVSLEELDPAVANVIRQCQQQVRNSPRSGERWGRLGMALVIYEFDREAQECLQHAERFDPADARWPYFLGVSLLPTDAEAALDGLRRAVERNADQHPAVRRRLANILAENGNYDEARQHYQIILNRWNDEPGATLGMGRLLCAEGQFEQALEYLSKAAESPCTARSAHPLLITTFHRLGQPENAARYEQRLAGLPADQTLPDPYVEEASQLRVGLRAFVDYGGMQLKHGHTAEAKTLAERAVKTYPESPEAWMLMTRVHLVEQRFDAAIESASKAVQFGPQMVETQIQLGVTRLYRRELSEAQACFERAIELRPDLAEAHHNLGLCRAGQQDWSGAIEAFQEAVRLNSGFVDSYLGLADALAKTGEEEAAREAAQTALNLSPNDPRTVQLVNRLKHEP